MLPEYEQRFLANDGVGVAYIGYAAAGFNAVSYQWQDGLIDRAQGCRPAFTHQPGPPPLEFIDYRVEYRDRQPVSVTKTVTWDDGSVTVYLIAHDPGGRKKASVLKTGVAGSRGTAGT